MDRITIETGIVLVCGDGHICFLWIMESKALVLWKQGRTLRVLYKIRYKNQMNGPKRIWCGDGNYKWVLFHLLGFVVLGGFS